ncbi:MAG TPA: MFS transporter [Thermoanaerobaculia bacterium]|nr:MFS transporter [Thermoanaerobaculia bacterium]
MLFVHSLFGQTGFRLLQAPTFFPTYIRLLTGSDAAVGIARAVQSAGMFLSPFFGVGAVQSRKRVKGLLLGFGSIMRLQLLLLAAIALFLPPPVAAIVVWPVVFLWGVGTGLQMVAFNFVLAKTVPTAARGRLLGARSMVAGITLIGVSAAAGLLLQRYGFPRGYGLAFLLAFALTSLGLASLAWLREPETLELRPVPDARQLLREVPGLLRGDASYTRFVGAHVLASAARGALPYYILWVAQRHEISGALLAGLTIAYTVAQAVLSLVWGLVGDRAGFVRVLALALVVWLGGSALALFGPDDLVAGYVVFVLVAAGFSGHLLAAQALALEFGREGDRALRIATSSALGELVGTVGFLAAGLLAHFVSIQAVLVLSMVLQISGLGLVAKLRDPRASRRVSG